MVLDVHGARYRYGTTVALDGVDLEVAPGRCVALLGPNGAGKTTLVGLATGLLPPQQGTVEVLGGDPRRAATRRHLGVVQQSVGFPRTLTAGELVRGAAVRAGLPSSAAGPALAEARIAGLARRRAGKLSGGQQQRLQLAMALVSEPALLVLDEPTVGLDVPARQAFWRTIAARRDRGAGVLLTTHVVEEAAAFADEVVILHRGGVLAIDTPAALSDLLPDRTVTATTALDDDALRALLTGTTWRRDSGRVVVGTAQPEPVVRALLDADPELRDLRVEGASLERALVHMTGSDDDAEVAA
jgi:ABC-2 type transport system ATP-binding protein